MDANKFKIRFSLTELAHRWNCTENTIIDYIEDGVLPVYAKSYILTYTINEAITTIQLVRKNSIFAADLDKLIKETNSKANDGNPCLPNPLEVKLGGDCKLDNEDIAIAALDNFSQCIILKKDIENFEKKHNLSKAGDSRATNTNINPPNIQRANDFNKCIAQVIEDFIEINNYSPISVVEVLNHMKHRPPLGTMIDFRDDQVSINGSSPKSIVNVERAIKGLLKQK